MICTHCDGKGIYGSGDFPLTLSGTVKTCEDCKGTGNVIQLESDVPDVMDELE